MTTELFTLLALAALSLAMPLVYGPLHAGRVGLSTLMGNREGLTEPPGAAGRGIRAHRNLTENLVPYAAVVLTAQALGVTTATTASAAVVFLIARIVHAGSYIAGIGPVRTVAYFVGVLATLTIAAQILFR